jgi:hypothetical protein
MLQTREVWRCLSKAGCLRKVVQRESSSFAMVMGILLHFSLKVNAAACTALVSTFEKEFFLLKLSSCSVLCCTYA